MLSMINKYSQVSPAQHRFLGNEGKVDLDNKLRSAFGLIRKFSDENWNSINPELPEMRRDEMPEMMSPMKLGGQFHLPSPKL
ncbi:hypothetical protein llap_7206 [Limosa lapponica baueri]|uniref:Uncharacterized protein n=1 Tax=Limosa lapponica baueri TaxID=1758121 RepID=A0A2I0U8Z2_LIMLA|nr:hypothetical protein llap_7206 [Limosa lapponica baueri]